MATLASMLFCIALPAAYFARISSSVLDGAPNSSAGCRVRAQAQEGSSHWQGQGQRQGQVDQGLLLRQLLKKLQQILKAIPGRKLALWRAAQQSLFLLTSSASKKILFGVHDITGLPVEAQPPEGCKGQHSSQ